VINYFQSFDLAPLHWGMLFLSATLIGMAKNRDLRRTASVLIAA